MSQRPMWRSAPAAHWRPDAAFFHSTLHERMRHHRVAGGRSEQTPLCAIPRGNLLQQLISPMLPPILSVPAKLKLNDIQRADGLHAVGTAADVRGFCVSLRACDWTGGREIGGGVRAYTQRYPRCRFRHVHCLVLSGWTWLPSPD